LPLAPQAVFQAVPVGYHPETGKPNYHMCHPDLNLKYAPTDLSCTFVTMWGLCSDYLCRQEDADAARAAVRYRQEQQGAAGAV